jgi:hypothetical protein
VPDVGGLTIGVIKRKDRTPPTQEELASSFYYKDAKLYWKVDNKRVKAGTRAGSIQRKPLRRIVKFRGNTWMEHRLIWQLLYGDLKAEDFIDHIDTNPLNNSVSNLRKATNAQNQHNQKLCSRNSSGVKGVCWIASKNSWRGSVRVNGTRLAKHFSTKTDAAVWVVEVRKNHHGSYARDS